jgi:hypothetical protein
LWGSIKIPERGARPIEFRLFLGYLSS